MKDWDYGRCVSLLESASTAAWALRDLLKGLDPAEYDAKLAVRRFDDMERDLKVVKRLLRAEARNRR